jgi:uroporphyrinogen decarboxylase
VTNRDIILAQLHHEETDFVPYDFRLELDTQNQLTEYYGSDDWKKNLFIPFSCGPDYFDSWNVMRQYDPNDPTKTTDPFGCLWTMTSKISHLDRCAIHDVEIQDYVWPTLQDFYNPEREARLKQWGESLPKDQCSLISLGAGYWEHMWRLFGIEEALMLTVADPDAFEYVLDKLDGLFHQFLDILVQTPADVILLSDDWCDQRSCIIGPERWRKHIKPRLAGLYKKIHDHGKLVVNHVCGNVTPLMGDLVEIGLDVLESVQPEAMDPYENKKAFGDRIAFYGGLGVQHKTVFGTPDEVRDEIRHLRREMSRGGGYILTTAKPLNESHPIENIAAVYETFVEENAKLR